MASHLITGNEFYCTQCGSRGIPVEWDGYTHEDFLIELEYHNFTPDGQRVMPYGELRGLIHNGKI